MRLLIAPAMAVLVAVAMPVAANTFTAAPKAAAQFTSGTVLLRVTVEHSAGSDAISVVAAEVSGSDVHAAYPAMYDDGTHGDLTAGDSVYSLETSLPTAAGNYSVIYYAVDSSGVEIVTEPASITRE